jgi:hypothetical protein
MSVIRLKFKLRLAFTAVTAILLMSHLANAKMELVPKAALWKHVVRGDAKKVDQFLSLHIFDHQQLGKVLWVSVTRSSLDNHKATLEIVKLLLDKGAGLAPQ